jgi:hypothetical protein
MTTEDVGQSIDAIEEKKKQTRHGTKREDEKSQNRVSIGASGRPTRKPHAGVVVVLRLSDGRERTRAPRN